MHHSTESKQNSFLSLSISQQKKLLNKPPNLLISNIFLSLSLSLTLSQLIEIPFRVTTSSNVRFFLICSTSLEPPQFHLTLFLFSLKF